MPTDLRSYFSNIFGSAAQAQRPTEPEEEELESLSTSLLRGFIEQNSVAGEVPSQETFDQSFRKSVSPAREFLANMMYGMSSGFTGQKMRTARERAFEEWTVRQKLEQERQLAQQRQAQSVANLAYQLLQARRMESMRRDLAAVRAQTDEAKRLDAAAQFALRYGLDVDKFRETMEHHRELLERPKDAFFDMGRQEALAEMQQQGLDPASPDNKLALLQRAVEIGNELYAYRQKLRGSSSGGARPRFSLQTVTNPFGEQEYGVISYDESGIRSVSAPPWWGDAPRTFSVEQLNRFQSMRSSIDAMRAAIQEVARDPENAVGGFLKAIPPEWRSVLSTISPAERNTRVLFNAALSRYLLGMSGVAVSRHEEKRVLNGLPRFYERPANFIPGAQAFVNMLEAMSLRQQAGIDPAELDLSELQGTFMDRLQKELQKADGKRASFRIPTAEDFLEQAAATKGYTIIRDSKGRIRGLRKK